MVLVFLARLQHSLTKFIRPTKENTMASPKPKPTPSPTKKGLTVAISKGVTMDLKTGVRTTAKPKPKALPSPKSDAQYFADQKKFIAERDKAKLEAAKKAKKAKKPSNPLPKLTSRGTR